MMGNAVNSGMSGTDSKLFWGRRFATHHGLFGVSDFRIEFHPAFQKI